MLFRSGLMAVCVGMYPSFAGSMDDVSALFSGMGDFSAAFGLDKLELGTIMGFYGTECGNILGLGGAFYAALTAMGMLAGEEGGHTAEFLLTHPVSRLRVAGESLLPPPQNTPDSGTADAPGSFSPESPYPPGQSTCSPQYPAREQALRNTVCLPALSLPIRLFQPQRAARAP